MLVVSDTSPLNYLVLVGAIDTLPALFDEVFIPPSVIEEMFHQRAPKEVRHWASQLPLWLQVRQPSPIDPIKGLHRGETEAIALALELDSNALLIDERAATKFALDHGIRVIGTLAVLAQAIAKDLLDLQTTIDRLTQTNFRGPIENIKSLVQHYRSVEESLAASSKKQSMKILGLLGGVASGKSSVAEMFRELGAGVLDADRAGHEVLRIPAIRAAVGGRWGNAVIGPDGEVDRKALAKIVFARPPHGPRELAELERITHPEIRKRLTAQAEQLAAQRVQIAILDAPVMLKSGWNIFCDAIALVDCPENQRRARATARGWTAEEFERREASQEPIEEKRRHANFVLDNSQDVSYIRTQVERCWQSLLQG